VTVRAAAAAAAAAAVVVAGAEERAVAERGRQGWRTVRWRCLEHCLCS
jgi:hypothetical protein